MKDIEIVNSESGDWEVLKVNGKTFAEGHHLNNWHWIDLIKMHFNTEVKTTEISDEDMEMGNY